MSKDPAFLFYPNDWLGGTMGMTFEEKGAYMDLLMMQFNRGHMTTHMIGQAVGQVWDKIKDKFEVDSSGCFYNKRLEEEQTKRKAFTDSRKNNKLGTNQHTKQVGHTTSHMEDEDEDVNISKKEDDNVTVLIWPTFKDFWDEYDKKVGDLGKVEKKWDNLNQKTKEEIMAYIPHYKQGQPDKQYRKNPETFLNNKGWLDEIITKISKNGKHRKIDYGKLLSDLQEQPSEKG